MDDRHPAFSVIGMTEAREIIARMFCSTDQKQAIREQLARGSQDALAIVLSAKRLQERSTAPKGNR